MPRRNVNPQPEPDRIVLPSRFTNLEPFQRAMLQVSVEEMAANPGPCIVCDTEAEGVGLGIYSPDEAAELGGPPEEWVAMTYHICVDCQALGDTARIDQAMFEMHRKKREGSDDA
jgi:hypothetical protein